MDGRKTSGQALLFFKAWHPQSREELEIEATPLSLTVPSQELPSHNQSFISKVAQPVPMLVCPPFRDLAIQLAKDHEIPNYITCLEGCGKFSGMSLLDYDCCIFTHDACACSHLHLNTYRTAYVGTTPKLPLHRGNPVVLFRIDNNPKLDDFLIHGKRSSFPTQTAKSGNLKPCLPS